MPRLASCSLLISALVTVSAATSAWVGQNARESGSTQPGLGNNWRNSFCATERMPPFLSKRIALELVVPWSRDKINFSMHWFGFNVNPNLSTVAQVKRNCRHHKKGFETIRNFTKLFPEALYTQAFSETETQPRIEIEAPRRIAG